MQPPKARSKVQPPRPPPVRARTWSPAAWLPEAWLPAAWLPGGVVTRRRHGRRRGRRDDWGNHGGGRRSGLVRSLGVNFGRRHGALPCRRRPSCRAVDRRAEYPACPDNQDYSDGRGLPLSADKGWSCRNRAPEGGTRSDILSIPVCLHCGALQPCVEDRPSTHGCQHIVETTSSSGVSSRHVIGHCDRLSKPWWRAAGANSRPESPKGAKTHLPSLDSLISCGVRRIACVTSRPWRPEIKVPAGDRSGRRSVGLRLRVQNIASVQQPRNGDRNRRRLSGRGKNAVQWPVNPGVRSS